MTITISDPATFALLSQASGAVDVAGANGVKIGTFLPENADKLPSGFVWPFTDAEMEARRTQKGGRPVADILRDLREKYGS